MAWLLARPGVTSPIIGVTKPQHLEDGLGARAPAIERRDRPARSAVCSAFGSRNIVENAMWGWAECSHEHCYAVAPPNAGRGSLA